jgi:hypothetical protein
LLIDHFNKDAAKDAARIVANVNDETGNAPTLPPANAGEHGVSVHKGCYPGNNVFAYNTVEVNLQHNTRSFFAHFFGDGLTPDVGARAQACIGSIIGAGSAAPSTGFGMVDLLPIAIDNEEGCYDDDQQPDYGDDVETTRFSDTDTCVLQYGSEPCTNRDWDGCMPYSGTGDSRSTDDDFRVVDLVDSDDQCSDYAGGDSFRLEDFIADQIEHGVDAYCKLDDNGSCAPAVNGPWADCLIIRAIDPHDGRSTDTDSACTQADPVDWCDLMDGLTDRIAREGDCGLDADEAIRQVGTENDPDKKLYEVVECPDAPGDVSPRLATVFVFNTLPADIAQNFYSGSAPNGRRNRDNEGFDARAFATVLIESCWFEDTDSRAEDPPPPEWRDDCRHVPGADLVRMRVRFVRLLTQGEIGPPNASATNVGIALGE